MTTPADSATLPDSTRLGRTALLVTDREEMVAFYRDIVGLSPVTETDERSTLGVDGTPLIELVDHETGHERSPTEAGLYHNAFRVPSRAALGDALTRIEDRWHLDGASDHRVSEALYLTDPEGNGVEIYRDFSREKWPIDDDGRVQLDTDPLDLETIRSAASGDTRAPADTDLGHVHLEVTSLDTVREFYVDTLGFAVQTQLQGALFVSAGGYHHHLGANTWQQRTTPAQDGGLAWFEIVVPETEDVAALAERVSDRGIASRNTDNGLIVTDPDGIEIRLRAEHGA